jgi:MFS family permease
MDGVYNNKLGRYILLPVSIFLLYDFIQLDMMASVGPFLIQSIKVSNFELGIISSLFFYMNLLLLSPAAILLDTYSPKWVMIGSLVIAIMGLVIFALFPLVLTAVLWRGCAGVAGAFSYLSCVRVLASFFPKRKIGFLIGCSGIIIMTAGVIAQYPLVRILMHFGLQETLLMDAAVGACVILCMVVMIKQETIKKSSSSLGKKSTLTVYLKKDNWWIAIYAASTNLPLFVLGALWGSLYLQHVHHVSLKTASLITSMIFIGNMVGAPVMGWVSDRSDNRKGLMQLGASLYMATSSLLLLLPHRVNFLFFPIFFFLGVSTGSQALAYASVVDTNEVTDIAKATSLLSFLSVGGGAAAQSLFGWLIKSQETFNFERGMYIIFFAALLALGSTFFSNSKRINVKDA